MLLDPKDPFTVDADGRGTVSLTISNPMRSNGGNYKCTIVRCGKSYPHENKLCVHWIDIVQVNEELECGGEFAMECKYGPVDECILDCIWKKLHKDGTPTNISVVSRFETINDFEKGNSSLKIREVTLADAGEYQCIVKLSVGRQVVAKKILVVNQAPFSLEIPDKTTNEGISTFRLYLYFTEVIEDSLKDISDIKWYKGKSKKAGSLLADLKNKFTKQGYAAGLDLEKSRAFLTLENITTEHAGEYSCEVEVNGRKFAFVCTGSLKVNGHLLMSVKKNSGAIKGEDVELRWNLLKPLEIESFIFYKNIKNKWKAVAQSNDRFNLHYSALKEDQQLILKIFNVELAHASFYMLKCSTKNTDGNESDWYSSTSTCLTVEAIDIPNVLAFDGEDSATLTCAYNLKGKVDIQKWSKETAKGKKVIFDSENLEKTERMKYEARLYQLCCQLKINQVTVADAGVYTCEVVSKKKFTPNTEHQASTTLVVPLDVFGSGVEGEDHCVYRHPAIVFLANKHFIVFCEEQVDDKHSRGLSRRGKLMEHNRIKWENQQTILAKADTRFQNLVPIVVDREKGEIILLCVECTAQQGGGKLIQLKISNGKPLSDPIDVLLEWPKDMQESAQLNFIGV
ncbi:obscurin-like [Anneissia japonica]|uniref:obscurin-like n=1 Tax=Anneissia japonica TaxID=1529436 RepID=UPI0014257CCE|nr:obscurin-like [Anneissia japonica]